MNRPRPTPARPDQLRKCGPCTACCTIMRVPDMVPVKEQGERCAHQCSRGCRIQAAKPTSCQVFDCMWRQGALPDHWRPDKVGVVFATTQDGMKLVGHCDPARPNAWRKLMPQLVAWGRGGLSTILGRNGKVHTLVDQSGARDLPQD